MHEQIMHCDCFDAKLGRHHGVSNSDIRKRCRTYGRPIHPVELAVAIK